MSKYSNYIDLHSDNDSFGGWVVLKPAGNFNPQKCEPTTWFYGYSEATTIWRNHE